MEEQQNPQSSNRMQTLLDGISPHQILTDPFPHLVVTDVLPEALHQQLLAAYPPLDVLTSGAQFTSNQRFNLMGSEVMHNPAIDPVWREFVQLHVSEVFLRQMVQLFEAPLRERYPNFEKTVGRLHSLRPGLRMVDNYQKAEVLLDAQLAVNTPVTDFPSSVRRIHVDAPNKLFVGLYYLRHPQDRSEGGELELCRFVGSRQRMRKVSIDDQYVKVVKTIPYHSNTLVLFLNCIDALHGVTIRQVTPFPRCFFNLVSEVKCPLYNLDQYQLHWWRRAKAMILSQ